MRENEGLIPLFDVPLEEVPVCRVNEDLFLIRDRELLAVDFETGGETLVYPSPSPMPSSLGEESVELPFRKIWQMAFDYMESFDTADMPDSTIELTNARGDTMLVVNYYHARSWGNYVIFRDAEGREDVLLPKCSKW